jgi:hypothetical protein
VTRCVSAGLVKGDHISVDGSFIQANADHHSRVPREQLAEVAKVNRTVREYLVELEQENPVEPPVPQQDQVSTTDPDSTYATKGGPVVAILRQETIYKREIQFELLFTFVHKKGTAREEFLKRAFQASLAAH